LRDICAAERIEGLIRQLELTIRRLHIVHSLVFYPDADGKRKLRNSPTTVPFLLHTCAWSQVSDPRDKIYGALGLLGISLLKPDYSLCVEQVYARSAYDIMRHMGDLSLLSQSHQNYQGELALPSWVPGWTRPSVLTAPYLVFHSFYHAAKDTHLIMGLLDDLTLGLAAKVTDEIVEVAAEYDHQDCSLSVQLPAILGRVIREWMALSERHEPIHYDGMSPMLDAATIGNTGSSDSMLSEGRINKSSLHTACQGRSRAQAVYAHGDDRHSVYTVKIEQRQ